MFKLSIELSHLNLNELKSPNSTPTHQVPKLPAKQASQNLKLVLNINKNAMKPINDSEVDSDDDYDYVIPENNKSVIDLIEASSSSCATINKNSVNNFQSVAENEKISQKIDLTSRKSLSSTIDSGISTSSLISLNSSNNLAAYDTCSKSNSMILDEDINEGNTVNKTQLHSQNSIAEFEVEFRQKMENMRNFLQSYVSKASLSSKENNFLLKFLFNFIKFSLKQFKNEHACFHPNLNVFNKFKNIYREVKEFYVFYDKYINDEKKSVTPDFIRLFELINALEALISQNNCFSYHSQTSIEFFKKQHDSSFGNNEDDEDSGENETGVSLSSENYDNYQYIYDNCHQNSQETNNNNSNDYSDYCQIDEENLSIEEEINSHLVESRTLTKQVVAAINRKEAKEDSSSLVQRVSMADNMLLKFYFKHVDEYLEEMNSIYSSLSRELIIALNRESCTLANKLVLYGHKLVFISDTLGRNLQNEQLKITLCKISNILCDSLKLYAFRVKLIGEESENKSEKDVQLISDSMGDVFNISNRLKQIIVKNQIRS